MDILCYVIDVDNTGTVYKDWCLQYSYEQYTNTWRQHFTVHHDGIHWGREDVSIHEVCEILEEVFRDSTTKYCVSFGRSKRFTGYEAQDIVLGWHGVEAGSMCTVKDIVHWLFNYYSTLAKKKRFCNRRWRGGKHRHRINPRWSIGLRREWAETQVKGEQHFARGRRRLEIRDHFVKLYDDFPYYSSNRCWKRMKRRKQYQKHLK